MKGEVIGITTATRTDAQNLNFALPINYVRGVLQSSQTVKYSLAQLAEPIHTVQARVSLRSVAGSLSENEVSKMLKRKNFFSRQWDFNKKFCNPNGDFANKYEVKTIRGNKVVLDHATGLTWHQSGSEKYMDYDKAKQWVNELNRRRYAGYSDWRLPTLEEGASLIERSMMNGGQYIGPKFSRKQRILWTSDIVTDYPSRVWIANFVHGGCVHWSDVGGDNFVRPVRSGR
jgi:serine/threonine-protein kinase